MSDIPGILTLINGYASKGIMLPRTEFEISEAIRDFCVAASADALLGCAALHFYSPLTGEVRSLAVQESCKTRGIGMKLVHFLAQEAVEYELAAIFAFTYVPRFFEKAGFHEVERGILPLKVWKDCLRCSKFEHCDEIAVIRILDEMKWRDASRAPENGLLMPLPSLAR